MGRSTTPCYLPNNPDFIPSSRHQFPNDSESSSTRSTQARIFLYSSATNSANFLICPRMVCREYIQYGTGTIPCHTFTWESIPTRTYIVRRIHKWGLRGFFKFMSPHSPLTLLDKAFWRPKGAEFWNSSSNSKLLCPSPVRRYFFCVSSLPNCNMWFHRWVCLWRSSRYWDSKHRGLVDSHRCRPTERLKGSFYSMYFIFVLADELEGNQSASSWHIYHRAFADTGHSNFHRTDCSV